MAQNFIPCDRDQEFLLPPSMREWLPEDHLAWFVLDAVDAHVVKDGRMSPRKIDLAVAAVIAF